MKFLVDENLPPRLADWLRMRGHDAVHVRDLGLRGSPDDKIAGAAVREERVVVTRDNDFTDPEPPLRVAHLGIGNTSTLALLEWMSLRLESLIARQEAGEAYVWLD